MRCGFALQILVVFLSLEYISAQLNLDQNQNNRPGLGLLSSFLERTAPQLRMRQNILGAIAARIDHLTINGIRRGNKPNRQQNMMEQVTEVSTTTTTTTTKTPELKKKPQTTTTSTPHTQEKPITVLKSDLGPKNQDFLDEAFNAFSTTSKPKITRKPSIPGLPIDDDAIIPEIPQTTTVKTKGSKRPPIPGLPVDDDISDVLQTTTAKSNVSKRPQIPGLPSEEDDAPKNCTVIVTDPTVPKKPAIPGLPSEEEDACSEDGVGNRIDPNALKSLLG